ncbi:MAG TPA: NAD(P)-binding protein [Nitrososphaeraceae archaeon]|nr:NAD(P)-binding protein [Nitrososphaeraceae archaeon]
MTKKVIIIGAGISGLYIGALLVKQGINVEVHFALNSINS